MKLHRYWIKFDVADDPFRYPGGLLLGVGVTAFGQDDAIHLLQTRMFKGRELPPVGEIIEDVDVSKLAVKHVLPNMKGNPAARGIWFPQDFDYDLK